MCGWSHTKDCVRGIHRVISRGKMPMNRFTVPRNSDDDALSFSGRLRTNLDTQWQKISNSNQCFESSTLVSVKFASANPSIKNNATK